MRKWEELFDEPRPSFEVLAIHELPRVISFVGVSSSWPCSSKSYVHCEMEVLTVYKTLFKKADKGLHPMQHISYLFCIFILGF